MKIEDKIRRAAKGRVMVRLTSKRRSACGFVAKVRCGLLEKVYVGNAESALNWLLVTVKTMPHIKVTMRRAWPDQIDLGELNEPLPGSPS